jgi:hypothetical protein
MHARQFRISITNPAQNTWHLISNDLSTDAVLKLHKSLRCVYMPMPKNQTPGYNAFLCAYNHDDVDIQMFPSPLYISILSVTGAFELVFPCFFDLSKHTRPKKPSEVHDALIEVAVGVGLAV